MLALVFALALTAAPSSENLPAPVAPREATVVVHLPRAQSGLAAFRGALERLGAHVPMVRPDRIGNAFEGILGASPLDARALDAAGFDLRRPMTLSHWGRSLLLCLSTKPKFDFASLDARLKRSLPDGRPASVGHQSALLGGIERADGQGWLVGRATLKATTCVALPVWRDSDVLPSLRKAVEGMGPLGVGSRKDFQSLTRGEAAPIIVFLNKGKARLGARVLPGPSSTRVEGRLQGKGPLLAPRGVAAARAGGHRTAALSLPAAVLARVSLSERALAPGGEVESHLSRFIGGLCPKCGDRAFQTFLRTLLGQATGDGAFALTNVDPQGGALSFGQGVLLEVRDALPVKAALQAQIERLGLGGLKARAINDTGYEVTFGTQKLWLGLFESHFYFSMDRQLLNEMLTALSRAAPKSPRNAVAIDVDGPRLLVALQKFTPFDLLSGGVMAGLGALKMEAGSALQNLDVLALKADAEGEDVRFSLEIALKKLPRQTPPAESGR